MIIERVLGAVLKLYPRPFRRRFAAEMLEQARALSDNRELSGGERFRRGVWMIGDALSHIGEARRLSSDGSARSWETLTHETRESVRRVRRSGAQSVSVVGLLGASIGGVTVALALVTSVLMPDLGYPNQDRLVMLFPEASWSRMDVRELDRSLVGIELSYYNSWGHSLVGVGDATQLRGALVAPNFFDVLGIRAALGRGFIETDGSYGAEPVVVVSHELWRTQFGGDTAAIGQVYDFRSTHHSSARLVGVLPQEHRPIDPAWQIWTPDRSESGSEWDVRRFRGSIGLLSAGVEINRVAARLDDAVGELSNKEDAQVGQLVPIRDWVYRDVRRSAMLFLVAALAVLGMAVTNVAVIERARQLTQLRNAATRMVLGASGGRVALGHVLDNLIRSTMGGTLGVVVALFLAQLAGSWLPLHDQLRGGLEVGGLAAGGAVALCVLIGLLLGIDAARAPRRIGLRSLLSGNGLGGRRGGRSLNVLVGFQVGVTLSMSVLSALLLLSVWKLSRVDPGFDPEQVLSAHIYASGDRYQEPEQTTALFEAIRERLESLPGVKTVGSTHTLPLTSERWGAEVAVDGGGADTIPANYRMVSRGFFRSLGLSLVRGRFPTPDDRAGGEVVAVVNNTLAARLGIEGDVVVPLTTNWGSVLAIGVAQDVLQHGLSSTRGPEIYVLVDQLPWAIGARYLTIAADPNAGITPRLILDTVSEIDPDVVVSNIAWMDEVGAGGVADVAVLARFVAALGVLALFLGSLGVWGVTSQSARARRHELGVRAALGANRGRLVRGAMSQMAWVASVGLLVGLGGTLLTGPLVASYLYGVEVGALAPTAFAVGITMTVAMVSAWIPARTAANSNPLDSLRPR